MEMPIMLSEGREGQLERRHHVTVCVCTYKRLDLLLDLLHALCKQRRPEAVDYSVVVVDNDCTESARDTVSSVKKRYAVPIEYYCEAEQNIALARNKAIDKSRGDLIAFIDDDECPQEDWLVNLYLAFKRFGTDGVLGPVKPRFQAPPPRWIPEGHFFDRRSFTTGTLMRDVKYMRTGNVLFRRSLIDEGECAFDRRFGKSGGEDTDFFRRKLDAGCVFVWCDEAVVYEAVPTERLNRTYLLRRALLRGLNQGRMRRWDLCSLGKSLIAAGLYTSALPVLLVASHRQFMNLLIKDCDHVGKLLAACGLEVIKERLVETTHARMPASGLGPEGEPCQQEAPTGTTAGDAARQRMVGATGAPLLDPPGRKCH